MGLSIDEIGCEYTTLGQGQFKLINPPKPHSSLKEYSVVISPNYGLSIINAFSSNISTNSNGSEARIAFEAMLQRLTAVYGQSALTDDLFDANPNESNWLQSIIEGKRFLFAIWGKDKGSILTDSIRNIFLGVEAFDPYSAYIKVQYVFENYDEARNELIHLEDDLL